MNLTMLLFFGFAGVLLALLAWTLWKPRTAKVSLTIENLLKECEECHSAYLPQIRQALSEVDEKYLGDHCSRETRRKVRREREQISVAFLGALKNDFENLLGLAQLIVKLSPQVSALQEWERLRVTLTFRLQFGLIRAQLRVGRTPRDRISRLGMVVSGLSLRVERGIHELGEQAAMALELGSALNRHGSNFVQ